MCAQRRTAVKRDQAAAAMVDAPRRASESRKAASSAPGADRPPKSQATKPQATKPQAAKAKASDSKPKATERKPHPLTMRIESLRRLYRDTRSEMAKITWPDKETTRNLTIVVIGISFMLGVLLGGIDFVFLELLEAMS